MNIFNAANSSLFQLIKQLIMMKWLEFVSYGDNYSYGNIAEMVEKEMGMKFKVHPYVLFQNKFYKISSTVLYSSKQPGQPLLCHLYLSTDIVKHTFFMFFIMKQEMRKLLLVQNGFTIDTAVFTVEKYLKGDLAEFGIDGTWYQSWFKIYYDVNGGSRFWRFLQPKRAPIMGNQNQALLNIIGGVKV